MHNVPKFLHVLINSDDIDSAEYKAAVAQLEREPQWQPALELLACGDSNWWSDARKVLIDSGLPPSASSLDSASGLDVADDALRREALKASTITVEIESSLADDTPVDCERVTLDFLEPPRHPELLGRLERYEVERVLGTGGMGVVLRAFDTDLHRIVAIKVLASHLAHNSSARRRFAREAQAAAAVVHPSVVPIYNVESDAKTPYIVMHYVAGQSLQRRVDVSGPLPIVDALRIAQQTAAGLSAAHAQGLVHRDVKPANILLEEKIDRVLLSDFGLARAVDDASLTKTGIVAGTPHYMSPEQALGEAVDHRSDLFSLGSVLYFMLTGHPPFRASSAMAVLHRICQFPHRSLVEVNRDVPIEVSQLVDRLLAKNTSARIASAAEAEKEISTLLNHLQSRGLSIQSSPIEPVPSPSPLNVSWHYQALRMAAVVIVCIALITLGRSLPRFITPTNMSAKSSTSQASLNTATSDHLFQDLPSRIEEARGWQLSANQQMVEMREISARLDAIKSELQASPSSLDTFDLEVDNLHQQIDSMLRDSNSDL